MIAHSSDLPPRSGRANPARRLLAWVVSIPPQLRWGVSGLILIVVLTLNAWVTMISVHSVNYQQEALLGSMADRSTTARVLTAAKDIETGTRGYFISDDRSFLEPYDKGLAEIGPLLQALDQALTRTPARAELILALRRSMTRFLAHAQQMVAARDGLGQNLQALLPLVQQQKDDMDAVRTAAAALLDAQAQDNYDAQTALARLHREASVSILVTSFVALLLATSLVVLVLRDLKTRETHARQRIEMLEYERRARTAAELANQAKDDFVASVSHELRTPLQSIISWTLLARRGQPQDATRTPADSTVERSLAIIERNSRSLAQIVDNLLDVSNALAGRTGISSQRVDLAEIVHEMVAIAQPAATAKDIALTVHSASESLPTTGDGDRLRQIIGNLVGNAVKFTQAGGHIEVEARRVRAAYEIRVRDNGIGMSSELLSRLFERYVQGSTSSTRLYSGLGLGLPIVKHFVELHGGRIEARSPGLNQGSEFIVTLPIAAAASAEDPSPATAPADAEPELPRASAPMPGKALAGVQVLVVDDDVDVRTVLELLLQEEGAQVSAAASAREALRMASEQRMDVILSDVGMPETDGYALARAVRALAMTSNATPAEVPMVALTAFSREDDARRAYEVGFNAHITKPVEIAHLIEVLCAQLRRTPPA